MFFDLHSAGRLCDRDVVLIDSNADLIGCYEAVRDAPEEVVRALDRLAAGHARDGRAHYYAVRDRFFNPLRARLRGEGGAIAYTPGLAAMFIYLNRTGFNGLFRLNAGGAFNVPVGRYDRPKICDRTKLLRVAAALASPRVRLHCGSFESALDCTRRSRPSRMNTAIMRTPIRRWLLPGRKLKTSKTGLKNEGSTASASTPAAITHEMNRFSRLT